MGEPVLEGGRLRCRLETVTQDSRPPRLLKLVLPDLLRDILAQTPKGAKCRGLGYER